MAMRFSTKQLQIDKAKAVMLGSVASAVFIVMFSLVAGRALLSQRAYQGRVIKEQEKALKQLKENSRAVDQLVASYKQFVEQPTNVLGGNPAGQGDRDGDNAKIILDALPSKYDFPALASSLEKILTERSFKLENITGKDDELGQSANVTTPTPVEMPYNFAVSGSYDSIKELTSTLQRSIRPFNIQTMNLSGSSGNLHLELSAITYYLPEKQLTFPTKEVR